MSIRSILISLLVITGLAGCQNEELTQLKERRGRLLKTLSSRLENATVRVASAERHLRVVRSRISIVERTAPRSFCAANELKKRGIKVTPDGAKLIVAIADKVLFAPGEAGLRPEAAHRLSEIIAVINETLPERTLSIEGHTDSLPPTRSADVYASNWDLSSARAVSVARYLVEKVGVDPKSVNAKAFADTKPISVNSTEEGRATNRRVEIVVLPKIETTVVSADL